MGVQEELDFVVEQWDGEGHVEEVLARTSNVLVGRGAFEAARQRRPKARLTLRDRARIIVKYEPEAEM